MPLPPVLPQMDCCSPETVDVDPYTLFCKRMWESLLHLPSRLSSAPVIHVPSRFESTLRPDVCLSKSLLLDYFLKTFKTKESLSVVFSR